MRKTLAAILLALPALLVAAPPANADPIPRNAATVDGLTDPEFDNSPNFAGEGDLTFTGATYRDDTVTMAVAVREPIDPNLWIPSTVGILWEVDIDGDGVADAQVHYGTTSFGVFAAVTDTDQNRICDAVPSYDGELYYASFSAACLGHPVGFSHNAFMYWDNLSTTASDFAPDNPSAFCCAVTETVTAAPPPPPPPPAPPADPILSTAGAGDGSGYWMISEGGEVFGFGGAADLGDIPAVAIDIEPTPSMNGYWALAKNGAIYTKGDAPYFGGATLQPGEEAASLSATSNGEGYWVFTTKGRVLAFGNAGHFGDMAGVALNGPVLDSVATPTGQGYWMVGSDGGIFAFGDATFSGSTGDLTLNQPVMSMTPDPDGSGYWLVASDGGIFAFDAPFYGSMGGAALNKPVSGIVGGPAGYLMVAEDGGIFAFGNVAFHGSLGANPPARPIVAVALKPATT